MDGFEKLLPTLLPDITTKERNFVRAFNGDIIFALKTAGYSGNDAYLMNLGRELLSRYEIQVAIQKNLAKAEKRESAILSKAERMEILSAIARNVDPYERPFKDEYGQERLPDPPSVSERIKAIDLLNKIEGDYQNNIHVKHEYSLSDMVLQSYKEDITPIDVIEAEYLKVREEGAAPIEPEKTPEKEEGLFI